MKSKSKGIHMSEMPSNRIKQNIKSQGFKGGGDSTIKFSLQKRGFKK